MLGKIKYSEWRVMVIIIVENNKQCSINGWGKVLLLCHDKKKSGESKHNRRSLRGKLAG